MQSKNGQNIKDYGYNEVEMVRGEVPFRHSLEDC